jgi:DNA-binding ferritin-like protein
MDPVLSSLLALWALHWQAKGQPFYGDHLLFERLYKARVEQIDSLAEVIAGHFGADKLEPMKAWKAAEAFMGTVLQGDSPLAIAMAVAKLAEDADAACQKAPFPAATRNFVSGLGTNNLTDVYLLKQRYAAGAAPR